MENLDARNTRGPRAHRLLGTRALKNGPPSLGFLTLIKASPPAPGYRWSPCAPHGRAAVKVHIVEDDWGVRDALVELVNGLGYSVVAYGEAELFIAAGLPESGDLCSRRSGASRRPRRGAPAAAAQAGATAAHSRNLRPAQGGDPTPPCVGCPASRSCASRLPRRPSRPCSELRSFPGIGLLPSGIAPRDLCRFPIDPAQLLPRPAPGGDNGSTHQPLGKRKREVRRRLDRGLRSGAARSEAHASAAATFATSSAP